jgi:hypothetical protein
MQLVRLCKASVEPARQLMSKQQILHQHRTAAGGTTLNAKLPVTFTAGVALLYAVTKWQECSVSKLQYP